MCCVVVYSDQPLVGSLYTVIFYHNIGPEGEKGVKGAPGKFGQPGIEGRKGDLGESGIPGRPGRQGIAGPKGVFDPDLAEPGRSGSIGSQGKDCKYKNVFHVLQCFLQDIDFSQIWKLIFLNV